MYLHVSLSSQDFLAIDILEQVLKCYMHGNATRHLTQARAKWLQRCGIEAMQGKCAERAAGLVAQNLMSSEAVC